VANAQLCRLIRAGDFDDPEKAAALRQVLRMLVCRKLEVANPRHLAAVSPK
jgi:hypothetical protein